MTHPAGGTKFLVPFKNPSLRSPRILLQRKTRYFASIFFHRSNFTKFIKHEQEITILRRIRSKRETEGGGGGDHHQRDSTTRDLRSRVSFVEQNERERGFDLDCASTKEGGGGEKEKERWISGERQREGAVLDSRSRNGKSSEKRN